VSKESRRATRSAARGGGTTGSSGPSGTPRAGRRERPRYVERRPFFERYRNQIVSGVIVAVIAVVAGVVFLQASSPAYACTRIFDPSPTPTVEQDSSTRLGYAEDDMGRSHTVGHPQTYLFCPPASGNHINQTGLGPIKPQVYGPDAPYGPPNWVHNMEHGAMVVLYRGDSPGATQSGQDAFRQFFSTFPDSPICKIKAGLIGPVIARFDQMPHAYAVMVWDRVLYMDSWDPDLALRFWATEGDRVDKDGVLLQPIENVTGCVPPTPTPGPSDSAAPSVAPSASAAPSAAPSTAPSGSPEPTPSPAPS
jgi:hypothetical protein